MLRFTGLISEKSRMILKWEGQLMDRWVDLFLDTCQALVRQVKVPLVLDLSEVAYANEPGLDALRRLEQQGVRSIARSGFLQRVL